MGFQQAVENTPGLQRAYRPGLQAIRRIHREEHISCRDLRILTGSIDLDSTLAALLPNDPRWDYGVGLDSQDDGERIVWIEVHPASSHHVGEVLRKCDWLKAWLRTDAPQLNALPREFAWIASGAIALQANTPQRRRLAACGLRFAGKHLQLS